MFKLDFHTTVSQNQTYRVTVLVLSVFNVGELISGLMHSRKLKNKAICTVYMYVRHLSQDSPLDLFLINFRHPKKEMKQSYRSPSRVSKTKKSCFALGGEF